MKIWESLIDSFVKDVKNYHIFKEVRVYYLATERETAQLFRKKALTSPLNARWYRGFDANSVTFLFSDMLSQSWSSGELLKQIEQWQSHFPFAIVQMLPQRLWNGTKPIDAFMGKMSSRKQFSLNGQIVSRAEEILAKEEEQLPQLVKIPLLNFNENSIEAYGRVMRSLPNNRIEGALFEAEDFKGEYHPTTQKSEQNAEQRLRGFYKYASREAKALLELLAVVPLSLPIVKLVQQRLLPQSTQEHLSEIFMSNIIAKEQKIDGFYQFSKKSDEEYGVRDELIKKIGAKRAFQTIVQLSEVIQQQGGVFDFLAFVVDPESLKQSDAFSEIDREFARVSVALLRQMGERYSYLADKIVNHFEVNSDAKKIEIVAPKSKPFIMSLDNQKKIQFSPNILIVESDVLIAEEMKVGIKKMGYEFINIAFTYTQAIQSIDNKTPDLILLEIDLQSKYTGIDIANYDKVLNKIPVIYMVGGIDPKIQDKIIRTNPKTVLVKPFMFDQLKIAINLALSHKKSTIDLGSQFSYDLENRNLFYKNEPIKLSPKEKHLLEILIEKKEQLVPSRILEEQIWG